MNPRPSRHPYFDAKSELPATGRSTKSYDNTNVVMMASGALLN